MNVDRDDSTERRPRELAEFGDMLRARPSRARLHKWVGASAYRVEMFADVVWGWIRWPKALGRPAGSTLSSGFVVEHHWYFDIWHVGLNGDIVEKNGWAAGDPPSVWDAPDEPQHWAVQYLFKAGRHNRLEVSFSSAGWLSSGPLALRSFRWLNPKGFEFPSDGGLTVLPPITVERQHFTRG